MRFGYIHCLKHYRPNWAFLVSNVTIVPFTMRKKTVKVVSYCHSDFFQVNIFVQMQVGNYLYIYIYIYIINENEIMYSSGRAKILRFRLRQTGQEVLYYSG